MSDVSKVLDLIKENDVQYVDLRFTDPRGKWQHTAQHVATINEDSFVDGFFFDGSSIAGWKAINESDMILMPDATTATMDPFTAQPQLIMICDVIEPLTGEAYARDPRSAAKRAEAYLKSSGIGDTAYFGPEAEFFVFDDVRYDVSMNRVFYQIDSEEGPYNTGHEFPEGNFGHRPGIKGGYFPVPPVDSCQDIRSEMLSVMSEMGGTVEKHHHEVGAAQHELGMKYASLTDVSDQLQIYKYVVHQVAHAYGKTATFMPKPVFGDN
ncbi:MAG: glutamine synthetase beta-grasp domain-containing protein, partial [Alphaproteobacteria bacterium]|nr:glutamine synthetase beta-grasp domain-containing protein [Alphaproteobacteria bacterium]